MKKNTLLEARRQKKSIWARILLPLIFGIFLINFASSYIVFEDNFSDGDFTSSPVWVNASGSWTAQDFVLTEMKKIDENYYINTSVPYNPYEKTTEINATFILNNTAGNQFFIYFFGNASESTFRPNYGLRYKNDGTIQLTYNNLTGAYNLNTTSTWSGNSTHAQRVRIIRDLNGTISVFLNDNLNISNVMDFNKTGFNSLGFLSNVFGGGSAVLFDNITIQQYGGSSFAENNQYFTTPVLSGATTSFTINGNYNVTQYPNAQGILNYNGTNYTATQIGSGDNTNFTASITLPLISGTSNLNFSWFVVLTQNSTHSNTYQSVPKTQQLTTLAVDNCSVYTNLILNYTLKDEETQRKLNNSDDNGTIEVNVQLYTISNVLFVNFSQVFSNTSNAKVCLDSGLTSNYKLDAKAKYLANNYQTEYNVIRSYIVNASVINATSQYIDLLDLLTASSTVFDILYKDSSFIPVPDAVIDITREYVGEFKFKTVEKPITDITGRVTASMIRDSGVYTINVYKNGVLLSTFERVIPKCQNILTGECSITLNAVSSVSSPTDFRIVDNLYYTLSYNNNTKTVTATFITIDGSSSKITLNGTLWSQYLNETACSDSLTSSSGTLNCVIPSAYGNQTILVSLYKDSSLLETLRISLFPNPRDYFGSLTAIFFIVIMLTIPLMFMTSMIGMLIGSVIGMVFAMLLLLSTGASSFSVSTSFIWFILAVAILIWKLNDQGNST